MWRTFKDAARLALEMDHTDTSMIFGHYRELVRADQAAKYWPIEPPLFLSSEFAASVLALKGLRVDERLCRP